MSPNYVIIESDPDILDRDPTEPAVFHNQQRKLTSPIQFSETKSGYQVETYVLYY